MVTKILVDATKVARAIGLSGIRSKDLSVELSIIKVPKSLIDSTRFLWAIGFSGTSTTD